ncbi:MAG: hypothetical protein HC787_09685, partial [Nostocaceae cyanobacterium CSU_2_110]|nr:hypothetical protein [Nostocaceae cyanobacterium CSU_2_110]
GTASEPRLPALSHRVAGARLQRRRRADSAAGHFWVVSQFSGLTVKQALKSFTIATLFQGLVGILVILLIQQLFS